MTIAIAIAIVAVILVGLLVRLERRRRYLDAASLGGTEPLVSTDVRERRRSVASKPAVQREPVTVLETDDAAELLVAKSLLEAGDIPYYVKGELAQDFIGTELLGGSNFAIGPVALQVPAEMAEKAKALLENEVEPD